MRQPDSPRDYLVVHVVKVAAAYEAKLRCDTSDVLRAGDMIIASESHDRAYHVGVSRWAHRVSRRHRNAGKSFFGGK